MVQQQIVEYAKAQLGLGISEEVIKNALVDAGWTAQDVDDSIKSVVQKKPAEVSSSISPSSPFSPSRQNAMPGSSPSQPINLKDLFGVAGAKGGSSLSATPTTTADSSKMNLSKTSPISMDIASLKKTDAEKFTSKKSSGGSKVVLIVLVVIALAGIAGAVYFFISNKQLADRVAALTSEGAASSSTFSGLSTQIADLTASKQELDTQLAAAVKEASQLHSELAFFVVPNVSTGTVSFSINGKVAVDDKAQYSLTTSNGLKVTIKNSKEQKVDSALKPLVGRDAEITGTHAPLSKDVTISAVNGVSL